MSKISCETARKHDLSCGFANVGGGVLNSYKITTKNSTGFARGGKGQSGYVGYGVAN